MTLDTDGRPAGGDDEACCSADTRAAAGVADPAANEDAGGPPVSRSCLTGAEASAPASGFRAGYVALVGRPNVGKSTLLNALVGEKVAIISPKPQTTRRRILGIVTTDTAQAILVDTPGIHSPSSMLGRRMVAAARRAIPDADVVVWVVDVSVLPTRDDRAIARTVRGSGRRVFLALNKCDLLAPENILENTQAYASLAGTDDWVMTVARDRYNLDLLWRNIEGALPEGPAWYPPDQITDQTDRMLAAELVREAALRYLRQEVPHGIEVAVTEWQTRENGMVRLAADVYVEREAHKSIVIGAGGRTIKTVGASARRSIERLLGTGVYLELTVKVRPRWRQNAAELRRMGFE